MKGAFSLTVQALMKKEDMKEIEEILRKYKTYHAGKVILQEQLQSVLPSSMEMNDVMLMKRDFDNETEYRFAKEIKKELQRYRLITYAVDVAIEQLDVIENEFVHYRYFEDKAMKEISIEMGYGEKHLFNLRKRLLEKLSISLRGLIS